MAHVVARRQEVHDYVIEVVEEPVVRPLPGRGISLVAADQSVRRAIRMQRLGREEDQLAAHLVQRRRPRPVCARGQVAEAQIGPRPLADDCVQGRKFVSKSVVPLIKMLSLLAAEASNVSRSV
jgi:hypothetical protein